MNLYSPLKPEDPRFQLFSIEHLLILISLLIVDLFILIYLKRINNNQIKQFFGIILTFFIILLEISEHSWKIYANKWSLSTSLPLHLCRISAYISVVMLIYKKYFLFEIAYFGGLGGAIIALITPNLEFNFPHFMFFRFFIAHNCIILAVLYMIFLGNYRPSLRSMWRVIIMTNIYALFIAFVNHVLDSNYLYISHKPGGTTLLDLFGPWPYYLISMEFACIVVFILLYLPFRVVGQK